MSVVGQPSPLELFVAGERRVFRPGRVVLGRGSEVDVDLDHPEVSRRHAVLEATPAGWTLTDHSRNGTFVDGRRITSAVITGTTSVWLGPPGGGLNLTLVPSGSGVRPGSPVRAGAPMAPTSPPAGPPIASTSPIRHAPPAGPPHQPPARAGQHPPVPPGKSSPEQQGRLSAVYRPGDHVMIGRTPECDVVVDDLLVSRRHAALRRTPAGWELTDLGSGNGTFVNGRRISRTLITPADVVTVGHTLLQLQGDRLVTYVDDGDNSFEALDVSVTTPSGKTLLHPVRFSLAGRTLLAVIGPSGAGKSTLLGALVGTRPATTGDVRYAGRDLYDDYEELRDRIALVPQDDVLHTQLTVRGALRYAAQLRFSADTSPADRDRRVDEVIAELGLTAQAKQRITSLSGGQRKRTSVALELLTKPSLLFLDEPTSGLDPGKDRSLMSTLRTLADDPASPRTVVVVTHNVANLEVCDRLLLLAEGGWLAYFGPPAEALGYFQVDEYDDIFLELERVPGQEWARRYQQSPLYARYIGAHQAQLRSSGQRPPAPVKTARRRGVLHQFGVLCRRYLAVIAADRQYAIFLLALPLVLSLLTRAVPGKAGLSLTHALRDKEPPPNQLLLVLIIGAALMGAAASIRELVKERTIYARERAIGLSIGAYLASKVVVLVAIVGVQAVLFSQLSLIGHDPPDSPVVFDSGKFEVLVAVLAVAVTTMLVGLLISALIDNPDRGMPLLVLMIMLQLICSGGLFPVNDRAVLEQLAWLMPSRWAFAMSAVTTNVVTIARGGPDPLWEATAGTWFADCGVLVVMSAALIGLVAWQLVRLDPQRRARR